MRVKCLAQEHNTMSPARARTRSARSGVERANHEATYWIGSFDQNHDVLDMNKPIKILGILDHVYFVHASVDISTDSRPMYQSTYRSSIGRYGDRHIGRASVDMSTDTRPICRPIRRPSVIVRLPADMSIDRLPTFRRYFTATCPGCVAWNKIYSCSFISLYHSYHYLRTFWERCLLLPASQRILCINPA